MQFNAEPGIFNDQSGSGPSKACLLTTPSRGSSFSSPPRTTSIWPYQVLRTDAAFSAEVLKLGNSPLNACRGRISSVLQAVMMLGLERIKDLAATFSLRAFLEGGILNGTLRDCWRHNLATAILAERLARFLLLDGDICYTAGLLHDIGRLALIRARPDKYEPAPGFSSTGNFPPNCGAWSSATIASRSRKQATFTPWFTPRGA
ncbi:MAG TPA: HDOD domain-containing protein [Bryobacteraceae bacterium]|nr:HDOD domain-containing protein [Bryobacteraceae bacterium]